MRRSIVRRTARRATWITVSTLVLAATSVPLAHALYLDPARNVSLRMRAYSQVTISTEDSQQGVTYPNKFRGQMMQQRNFFNPELDADLEPYLDEAGFDFFDELGVRLTGWGFYDGLYDYGPRQYAAAAAASATGADRQGNPNCIACGLQTKARSNHAVVSGVPFKRNARAIYAHDIRVNEAYVDMAKGPLFLRIGKQAISWGEADTIGLLDANNPFNTTIPPGLFYDLDEARIPLWTIRSTYQLFSTLGPFSSGFLDAYLVPGSVDVTVSPLQMQGMSPFSAPPPPSAPPIEVAQILPEWKFGNSRWGARFQSVIAQDYTTSVWFYKTFPTEPVPLLLGITERGSLATGVQTGRLVNVIGVASSFYSAFLNSIVRTEVEVFNDTPGFRPSTNLGLGAPAGSKIHFDRLNIIRGEIGLDRNFFVRALNPANSFVWVSAIVFSAIPEDSEDTDYRASGILKPSALLRQAAGGATAGSVFSGCEGPDATGGCDFVNRSPFEFFIQSHIQTDYMHGKLTPGITGVFGSRGYMAIFPEITYRITDSFLFNSRYLNIHTFGSENNGFVDVGVFRDRDEIWFRAIYQLN